MHRRSLPGARGRAGRQTETPCAWPSRISMTAASTRVRRQCRPEARQRATHTTPSPTARSVGPPTHEEQRHEWTMDAFDTRERLPSGAYSNALLGPARPPCKSGYPPMTEVGGPPRRLRRHRHDRPATPPGSSATGPIGFDGNPRSSRTSTRAYTPGMPFPQPSPQLTMPTTIPRSLGWPRARGPPLSPAHVSTDASSGSAQSIECLSKGRGSERDRAAQASASRARRRVAAARHPAGSRATRPSRRPSMGSPARRN